MTEFDFRGSSLIDLQAERDMCAEGIAFVKDDGREPDPKMVALLAAYDAEIARKGGTATPSARIEEEDVVVGRKAGSRAANQYGSNFTVEPASEKQLYWVRKLAEEKDLSGATTPTWVRSRSPPTSTA